MNPIVEYFHKNHYSDLPIEDVASAIYKDENSFQAAKEHIRKTHYNDMPLEVFHQALSSQPKPKIGKSNPIQLKEVLVQPKIDTSNAIQLMNMKSNTPDLIREDGTLKGKGFLGVMPNGENFSTELSIGTEIDGKEALIPTMIPTLTQEELNHLLSDKYDPSERTGISNTISEKAIDFARERKAKGLPYFATPEEEGKFKIQEQAAKPKANGKQLPFYQGRQFMEETGLRPDFYTPEQVAEAIKKKQLKNKRQ